jgi:hypothetical protein
MEKISKEIAEIKNNKGFAEAIATYINKKCKEDQVFQERVTLEDKKLEECLKYIMSEVKKSCEGAFSVAATDEEVFNIVDTYYNKEHSEIEIDKRVQAIAQAPERKTEYEETHEEEEEKPYARVDAPEKVEKPKPEKKSILNKKPKERDSLINNQVSLFDLLG